MARSRRSDGVPWQRPRGQPGGPTPEPPPDAPPVPRSGWAAFDALGLVKPGRVLLVDAGCEAASRLLMGLLAGTAAAGKDAVVVDGGNWLDVYRLGDAARLHDLRRETVLDAVRLARGFTAHQLQSLVEDALPQALVDGGDAVGLALASGLPEMYLDEDLAPSEARILLARALRTLRDAARRHHVPVVASNMTLAPRQRHKLRAVLDAGVDDAVSLLAADALSRDALRILPRGARAAILDPGPRARQRVLGDYEADATTPDGAFYRRAIDARIKYAPKHAGELKAKQRMSGADTLRRVQLAPGGA